MLDLRRGDDVKADAWVKINYEKKRDEESFFYKK
jgi:hypothetical protein